MVYEMRVKVHSWLLSAGGNEKKERAKTKNRSQSVRHKKQLRKSETKRKKEAKRSINKIHNNNYNNKNNNLITNVACAFHQLHLPIFVAVSFCLFKKLS